VGACPDTLNRLVLAATVTGLVLLAGLAVLYVATPPPGHVVRGCLWWTATPVDQVVPGDHGCIRGYFAEGGYLADSTDSDAQALRIDVPYGACRPTRGDPMVVRGEAVFQEGRTMILVDDCR